MAWKIAATWHFLVARTDHSHNEHLALGQAHRRGQRVGERELHRRPCRRASVRCPTDVGLSLPGQDERGKTPPLPGVRNSCEGSLMELGVVRAMPQRSQPSLLGPERPGKTKTWTLNPAEPHSLSLGEAG